MRAFISAVYVFLYAPIALVVLFSFSMYLLRTGKGIRS